MILLVPTSSTISSVFQKNPSVVGISPPQETGQNVPIGLHSMDFVVIAGTLLQRTAAKGAAIRALLPGGNAKGVPIQVLHQ